MLELRTVMSDIFETLKEEHGVEASRIIVRDNEMVVYGQDFGTSGKRLRNTQRVISALYAIVEFEETLNLEGIDSIELDGPNTIIVNGCIKLEFLEEVVR